MSDPGVPPRGAGAHRGSSQRGRQAALGVSLLGVVAVGTAVGYALHQRGEDHRSATSPTAASRSVSSTASSPAVSTSAAGGPSSSRPASTAPASGPGTASALPAPSSSAAVARPALDVLNNSRISGLAAKAAQQFRSGGWVVARTGNFEGRLPETTVYYPSGEQSAAEALARQFPQIRRVEAAPAGLSGAELTVVLTKDWDQS